MFIDVLTTCPISQKHISGLIELYPQFNPLLHDSIDSAIEDIPKAQVILTYGEDLKTEHIEQATNLKWINVLSAGLELMPFDAIRRRGIIVTNSKGIHATPMAEHAMMSMLNWERKAYLFHDNQRKGIWDRSARIGELRDKTVCIFGVGAIGQEVARLAKAFGMKVKGVRDSGRGCEHIDKMYSKDQWIDAVADADYIISLMPLTEETRGYFDKDKFKEFKSDAVFVNMARGGLVNTNQMIRLLEEGLLAGAILDVFEEEPLPTDSPLYKLPNVHLTPHISGRSHMYMTRAIEIFRANFRVFLLGEGSMINLIDTSKGY